MDLHSARFVSAWEEHSALVLEAWQIPRERRPEGLADDQRRVERQKPWVRAEESPVLLRTGWETVVAVLLPATLVPAVP